MARHACFVMDSALVPVHVVRCAVHGICVLSVDTRASVPVEKGDMIRIATVMTSYHVQCSDEFDILAHNHISIKYDVKKPSQSRQQRDQVQICAPAAGCLRDSTCTRSGPLLYINYVI